MIIAAILFTAIAVFWLWSSRPRQPNPHPFPDVTTEWVEAGEWRIRLHRSGKGPPLILVHGLGADLYCWRRVIPQLGRHFTLVIPDLPGFGRSAKPVAGYGLDEQIQRLDLLLEKLAVGPAYWLGNSMGGNLALWYALSYPQKVLGTAVIGPALDTKIIPLPLERALWLAGPLSWLSNRFVIRRLHERAVSRKDLISPERVEETFTTYGRESQAVRSLLSATNCIRDRRLKSGLLTLKRKVLVLWGSGDTIVPPLSKPALEAALPSFIRHDHPTGGHHLQEDEPDWVAEKTTDFFLGKHD